MVIKEEEEKSLPGRKVEGYSGQDLAGGQGQDQDLLQREREESSWKR